MLIHGFDTENFANWTTWLTLGVGLTVTAVVFVLLSRYRRRRRLAAKAAKEDLPWEKLLEQLQARHREFAASGSSAPEDLPPEQFLTLLLTQSFVKPGAGPVAVSLGERRFVKRGGVERRANRRRWGNPTEVYLDLPFRSGSLRGLVINRSAPGLAIFINEEVRPGTTLTIRAAEAPNSVPPIEIEVKYCRKTRRNYIIGCHSPQEIPWNVRGWLG